MSDESAERSPPNAIVNRPGDAPERTKPLLEVRGLAMGFDGSWILRGIDLDIQRGQTVAVIGESGCGKTVFMKTLVRLLKPSHGSVRFDGEDLNRLGDAELAKMRRRFGFVFQNAALFDSMSIFDNVAFPLRQNRVMSDADQRDLVLRSLQQVGLPEESTWKYPAELSGGMRKRVGLARALILKPELVVYDEPTTGLDPIMSDVINELMIDTRRRHQVTSVIVTHDMRTVRKVADRVLMFIPRRHLRSDESSQILFDGPPGDLEHSEDKRVRQFVRGEAGARIREMARGWSSPNDDTMPVNAPEKQAESETHHGGSHDG